MAKLRPSLKVGRPVATKSYADYLQQAALSDPYNYGYLVKKGRRPKELKILSDEDLAEKKTKKLENKRKFKNFHI